MKKEKLETSPSHIARLPEEESIKLTTWAKVRSLANLEKLIEEHGTIYIASPNGLPFKVTKAKLY